MFAIQNLKTGKFVSGNVQKEGLSSQNFASEELFETSQTVRLR